MIEVNQSGLESSNKFIRLGIIDANVNVKGIDHGFHYRFTGSSSISFHTHQSRKNIFNKEVEPYGKPWDSSTDSMIMTLDLRSDKYGTLTIGTEKESFGVLYDKIDVNKEWRMALTMVLPYTVQLVSIDVVTDNLC